MKKYVSISLMIYIFSLTTGFILFILALLNIINFNDLFTGGAILISFLALFRTYETSANIVIVDDQVEGIYKKLQEPIPGSTITNNGNLKFSLIFYNKGGEFSIVTVNKIQLISNTTIPPFLMKDKIFSIDGYKHYLLAFDIPKIFTIKENELFNPDKYIKAIIFYRWVSKGKTIPYEKEISINFESYYDRATKFNFNDPAIRLP